MAAMSRMSRLGLSTRTRSTRRPLRLCGLFALVVLTAGALQPSESIDARDAERDIFARSNALRSNRGLGRLLWDDGLAEAARLHAEDMLRRRYFSHDAPDGEGAPERVHRIHRRLIGLVAENLWTAWGTPNPAADRPAEAMRSWMESPGHRENLLKPDWTHLGVGVAWELEGKDTIRIMAVQEFAETAALLRESVAREMREGDRLNLSYVRFRERDLVGWTLSRPEDMASTGLIADLRPLSETEVRARPGPSSLVFFEATQPGRYRAWMGPSVLVR